MRTAAAATSYAETRSTVPGYVARHPDSRRGCAAARRALTRSACALMTDSERHPVTAASLLPASRLQARSASRPNALVVIPGPHPAPPPRTTRATRSPSRASCEPPDSIGSHRSGHLDYTVIHSGGLLDVQVQSGNESDRRMPPEFSFGLHTRAAIWNRHHTPQLRPDTLVSDFNCILVDDGLIIYIEFYFLHVEWQN